jgi:hypothetical protein
MLQDDMFIPHASVSLGDELEFDRTLVSVEEGISSLSSADFAELRTVTQDLTPLYQRQNARMQTNKPVRPLLNF